MEREIALFLNLLVAWYKQLISDALMGLEGLIYTQDGSSWDIL